MPVKFALRYLMQADCDPGLPEPGTQARVARAAEDAGFAAIAFTVPRAVGEVAGEPRSSQLRSVDGP